MTSSFYVELSRNRNFGYQIDLILKLIYWYCSGISKKILDKPNIYV